MGRGVSPRRDVVAPLDGVRHGPRFVGYTRDSGSLCSANYAWQGGGNRLGRSPGMFGAFASIVHEPVAQPVPNRDRRVMHSFEIVGVG
jgi:hypothetical protein